MKIAGMTNKLGKDKLIINVGGVKFKTQWSTIERIPGTRLYLLAKLREDDESYDQAENEYYFDRNPEAFATILEYYRSDELHIAHNVCGNAMKKELNFWGLYETEIEACCWGEYSKFLDHREVLANLDTTFGGAHLDPVEMKKLSKWKRFQMTLWNHLEYPSYSRGAKVLMGLSISVVMISILSFVCESHYFFQVLKEDRKTKAEDPEKYYQAASKQVCCHGNTNGTAYPETVTVEYLNYIDWGCLAFFSIELIVRFTFAPSKCDFFKSPLNIIDIVCIVPQIISITLQELESKISEDAKMAGSILQLANILRTVRVLRIFKLMKHYSAFKVLAYTIKVSTNELLLMVVFLMSGVMIFASIIHYAEPQNFTSIPIGIWWALVTMTTVGYGDRVPNSVIGYGLGCLCVIGGVLVIAFTVPIVVNNFTLYYSHANSRARLPPDSKQSREKSAPKLVAISPHFNSIPDRDSDTRLSVRTEDGNVSQDYGNNLNIDKEESVKVRSVKTSSISVKPFMSPKVTNQHEMEAREIVTTFEKTNRNMMNERRKQYMMAFKRLEDKKKTKGL